MTRFAISLGSNQGDRLQVLREAISSLGEFAEVLAVSSLYETAPIGGPEQGPFLNAIALVETQLEAPSLLDRTQMVEKEAGRTREVRWGPRTLDLDLIASDAGTLDSPSLTIPHPRSGERRFVLEPLCEVWPDAVVSGGKSAESALLDTTTQDVSKLDGNWLTNDGRVGRRWVLAQVIWFAAIGLALVWTGGLPNRFDVWIVIGATVFLAGLCLMGWSSVALGRNLTAVPEPMAGGKMVSSGPYGLVRHPMYTAVVLTFLGVSIFVGSWISAVLSIVLLGFFLMKSKYEERHLRMAYSGYGSYAEATRHRFIPGIF